MLRRFDGIALSCKSICELRTLIGNAKAHVTADKDVANAEQILAVAMDASSEAVVVKHAKAFADDVVAAAQKTLGPVFS